VRAFNLSGVWWHLLRWSALKLDKSMPVEQPDISAWSLLIKKEEVEIIFVMKDKKKSTKAEVTKSSPHLLKQLARRPEKLFSGAFRQQYGAICFRFLNGGSDIEILLVTSRDSGRWIIPKGWPIKKKKPFEAAATEAWEEAGMRGAVSKQPVGRYTYLKDLDDGDVAPCIVDVFQIKVTDVQADFKEVGERILAWLCPDEAARRVREVELKSLLVDFKPRRIKKHAR
jgi:8-oxo-dGTP pyrophosphatase MutT (NUDIX family)